MAASAMRIAALNPNGGVRYRRCAYTSAAVNLNTLPNTSKGQAPFSYPTSIQRKSAYPNRFQPLRVHGSNLVFQSDSLTFDVVIVGAGVIGLTIARHFLVGSNLSVAIVDAAVPCAGATGAGQGYIWRVHREPRTEKWELTMRSHELWENLVESVQRQGLDPVQVLGWKKTGSLLIGSTAEDCSVLRRKVEQLQEAGLPAEFLSSDDLLAEEPALKLGEKSGAAFMPNDCQIDARCAVEFILKANRDFAAEGRYAEFFHEPVTNLIRSESSGEIEAVQTTKNTLRSKKAVIVSAGCWSGSLMDELLKNSEIDIDLPVKPRKGHLLVLENFKSLQLNHGLMEVGYVNHSSSGLSSSPSDSKTGFDANITSISMTATMDTSGRLVLGSSRQLIGFSTEIDESIIHHIWDRAAEFFPVLKEASLKDLSKNREVRVGLRPYMPGGKPVIGAIPGSSKMFVAAGHEGEGLTLALGTAEMIFNMVLQNPQRVNPKPFSV